MGFSRPEHWSGLPSPPPKDLPKPGDQTGSPALRRILYRLSQQGSPPTYNNVYLISNSPSVPHPPPSLPFGNQKSVLWRLCFFFNQNEISVYKHNLLGSLEGISLQYFSNCSIQKHHQEDLLKHRSQFPALPAKVTYFSVGLEWGPPKNLHFLKIPNWWWSCWPSAHNLTGPPSIPRPLLVFKSWSL